MNDLTTEQKKMSVQVIIGLSILITVVNGIMSHSFTAQELALFLGTFLGIAAKVLIPFIRKLYEKKVEGFGIAYLWMMVTTFLYNIPVVFVILNQLDFVDIGIGWALAIAFSIGLGTQWLTEELYRLGKNQKGQFAILGTILGVVDELTESGIVPIDPPIETEPHEDTEDEEPEGGVTAFGVLGDEDDRPIEEVKEELKSLVEGSSEDDDEEKHENSVHG